MPGVDDIELDAVETVGLHPCQARGVLLEDELLRRLGRPGRVVGVVAEDVVVDVQPELVPEAADRPAEQAAAAAGVEALVLREVGPEAFSAPGVDVADDMSALRMKGGNRRRVLLRDRPARAEGVCLEVDVEDRGRDGGSGGERRSSDAGVDASSRWVQACGPGRVAGRL